MRFLLIVFAACFTAQTAYSRNFQSEDEVIGVLEEVFRHAEQGVLDASMLRYTFFDSGMCRSCSVTESESAKLMYRAEMAGRFSYLQTKYAEHLKEVRYQYQFTGDDYPDSTPFARSGEHVLAENALPGCDDFAKAFIVIALRRGYSPDGMRYVFLMQESGWKAACGGNIGHPARRWHDGGHEVVAIKLGGRWLIVNTTSKSMDYADAGAAGPKRLEPVKLVNFPFKVIFAGMFPVERYIQPFLWRDLYNIYVSGTPADSVCRK